MAPQVIGMVSHRVARVLLSGFYGISVAMVFPVVAMMLLGHCNNIPCGCLGVSRLFV